MRINLVAPNFHSGGPENIVGSLPPLHLLYIGGALKQVGYNDITLIDINKIDQGLQSDEKLSEYILNNKPNLIMIGGAASTPSFPRTIELAKSIKLKSQDAQIVIGGAHPTYMYKDIIKNNPPFDYIVRGEGEIPSQNLVMALDEEKDLHQIDNLIWRKNIEGKFIVNQSSNQIVDLNRFNPAWELIPNWNKYKAPVNNEIATTIQFSRGCGYKCTFCGQWQYWKQWHSRDPKKMAKEIIQLYKKFGVTLYFWADENPAQDQTIWLAPSTNLKERMRNVLVIYTICSTPV